MADIRINALATTASSTASDDFLAVDGSSQGTRKLSAYSPTFGGNLTVSGTGVSTFSGGTVTISNTSGTDALFRLQSTGAVGFYDFEASDSALTIQANNNPAITVTRTTQAVTLGGNLTVSGTAGNTFNAGALSAPSLLAQSNQAFRIISTTTAEVQQGFLSTTPFAFFLQVGGTDAYPLSLQPSGSKVLIGKTSDSANGILQLATHTTSAGGIGFGTDVSLYRSNTRELTFLGASTSTFIFAGTALGSVITLKLGDGTNNDQGVIESTGQGVLSFKRNNTTALTLDSSQNAKFAAAAFVNTTTHSSGVSAAKLIVKQTSGTADWTATIDGNPDGVSNNSYGLRILAGTSSSDYPLFVRNQANTTTFFAVKGSGRVNMGALPTSSAGLSAGDLWNDSGTVKIA